jgi:hypothetical protein
MSTYRIYGNSDPSPEGFPTVESIREYIGGGIFTEHDGRYRYSQKTFADKIILSREGIAYGDFDISRAEEPTGEDIAAYSKTAKVFIVSRATLYDRPVTLYRKDTPETGPESFRYWVRQAGLEIFQSDFDKIIAAAGETQSFEVGTVDTRYCRICFNSNGWRRPTGTADERTDSYYAVHRFGHEEWLFNYEWCLDGYKYGFLQPFNNVAGHRGKWFSLKLSTNLGGRPYLAGTISRLYVPHVDELQRAFDRMRANGWLDQMRNDVASVKGGDVEALNVDDATLIINVRFQQRDATLSDKMPEFPRNSKPWTSDRYKLLYDDDVPLPTVVDTATPDNQDDLQYVRAAQQGTLVDLAHKRLQMRLYDWLCKKYGKEAVRMELDFVDLRVTVEGAATFFEIKMDTLAKRCIRNAVGQLIEYSAYVAESKAKTWVVVGDPIPTDADIAYLRHLRSSFGLPIYFARFDWETGGLCEPV